MKASRAQSNSTTTLRERALLARRSLSVDARDRKSSIIAERIVRSHEFIAAKAIACYLPMHDEVDPTRVIERAWRAKKRIFSPVAGLHGSMIFRQLRPDTVLERNRLGLWEPVSGLSIAANKLDLVITPLVAFDNAKNRIGMGGGYFDRKFANLRHRKCWLRPKLIGVAFDCQKVEKIEPNPWDIPLYSVITELK